MSRYGWRRDNPDLRDRYAGKMDAFMPSSIDLRPNMPTIYDQGQLGSCTANAACANQENIPSYMPSRLFVYYNTRLKEGTTSTDSGASIRDTIKAVFAYGDCPEFLWTYDTSQFDVKPSPDAYGSAIKHRAISYQRLQQDLISLFTALASGYPIVFGCSVYTSFEREAVQQTGVVPMPVIGLNGETLLGGHAMILVGYEIDKQQFIVRNSWGPSYGDAGYLYMPFDYILDPNLSADFWILKKVL